MNIIIPSEKCVLFKQMILLKVFILENCIFFPRKLHAARADGSSDLSTMAFKEMRALSFSLETGKEKRDSGCQLESAYENSLRKNKQTPSAVHSLRLTSNTFGRMWFLPSPTLVLGDQE